MGLMVASTATGRKFLDALHYCRGLKKKGFQKDSTSLEKLSKYTVLHPFVTFQKMHVYIYYFHSHSQTYFKLHGTQS